MSHTIPDTFCTGQETKAQAAGKPRAAPSPDTGSGREGVRGMISPAVPEVCSGRPPVTTRGSLFEAPAFGSVMVAWGVSFLSAQKANVSQFQLMP